MDQRKSLEIIAHFKRNLESQNIRVKKMILFGSRANNTQREDSDIDLVVLSEDFKDKGYWQRIDILTEAIYRIFAPIEAVAMTPEEWDSQRSTIYDIAHSGVEIS